jgi:hypothetical protein
VDCILKLIFCAINTEKLFSSAIQLSSPHFLHPNIIKMDSGRNLRSRKIPSPVKSPKKAIEIESSKKQTEKSGQKSKEKAPADPKAANVVSALQRAQEYITKSSAKDANVSKRAKRAREEEEDDEDTTLVAAAHKLAASWMMEDDYALEIERRKEEAMASLARYEPMPALAKRSLKGEALKAKLVEIKNKIDNIEGTLIALRTLIDKRYDEIFDDALKRTTEEKKPSKRARMESTLAESEDLNVSDGKLQSVLEYIASASLSP